MRNSRFIELLNLYVDQQLSKEEAVELEREITRDPTRAHTYQQYCRMQKACTLLFEQERTQAPNTNLLARSLSDADRKVIGFPESRVVRWRNASLYAASLAAAACIAFAVVNRAELAGFIHGRGASANLAKSDAPTTPAVAVSTNTVVAANTGLVVTKASTGLAAPARRAEYFPVFSSKQLSRDEAATDLAVEAENSNKNSYEWMRTVELTPVAPFAAEQITLASTSKPQTITLRGQPSAHPMPTESAAFEFQR
jgi:hypothetical protein